MSSDDLVTKGQALNDNYQIMRRKHAINNKTSLYQTTDNDVHNIPTIPARNSPKHRRENRILSCIQSNDAILDITESAKLDTKKIVNSKLTSNEPLKSWATTSDCSEIINEIWTTKVVFTIHKKIENCTQLKEILISFMKKSDGVLNFKIKETISTRESRSICTVILKTASKSNATKLIKILHKKLYIDLKVKVHYDYFSTRKNRKKNLEIITNGNHVFDNVGNSLEQNGAIPDVFLKETVNQISNSINQVSIEANEPRLGNKSSSALRNGTMGKYPIGSSPIPTLIQIKIMAGNLDENYILSLLSPLKDLQSNISKAVVETSDKYKTICLLLISSKTAAVKITRRINAANWKVSMKAFVEKTNGCIKDGTMTKNEDRKIFKIDNDNKTRAKNERLQKEMQKELLNIESKSLEKHKTKIKDCEMKLDDMVKVRDDHEIDDSVQTAISDKKEELEKQMDEFVKQFEILQTKSKANNTHTSRNEVMLQLGIECNRLINALPMYARRTDIVNIVSSNQVSIILGETGSGKSTQLVQYLYEAGLAKDGIIVCTQPRKVAAITLAERVAQEMVGKVGCLVGYVTGVRKKKSHDTKIIFSTDHSLLNECLDNRNFLGYSCIIVDEAHERSIYTDLLLGMIKSSLSQRPDLKVIITSATIDPGIFIKYFNSGPELRVSGRMFPVEIVYDDSGTDVEFEDYERMAVAKTVDVHRNEGPGDILVFLTSPVEIMRCCEEFQKRMKGMNNFKCLPLHGQLPPDEQRKVFERLDVGIRKIVFATNCAETSITIDGVKFVIDTGVAKEVKYDAKKNISVLGTHVISKSSADQRKGRAGRTASGKCFRLYSENGYRSMEPSSRPEILCVHLGQAVLKIAALGIDCRQYDFVESPSQDAIDSALLTLCHLGAMSKDGITQTGKFMNALPFDPRQCFLIYHGLKEQVLYDSVVIASLLNNGSNIFYKGMSEPDQQKCSKSKTKYGSPDGDVFTWLEVYKDWTKVPKRSQSKWCTENSINYKVLNFAKQAVDEMAQILEREKIKMEYSFGENEKVTNIFKKLIFQAYTPSLSHYLGHFKAGYYALEVQKQIHFHPSSALPALNAKPEWIVYTEFTKTTRDFIKGICVVNEDWVQEALQEGRISFCMDEVKRRKIEIVHREELGLTMFRNFVGPRYSNLRCLEEELSDRGMPVVVVEADRELGIIDVYSSSPMDSEVATRLNKTKVILLETLASDEDEIPVIKNTNGTDGSGFRVVLGQGAVVKALLMPDESNKIIIKNSSFRTSEEDIRHKFEVFGDILECIKFKGSNPWGFIRYRTKHEAQQAVEGTANDEHNVASLKIENEVKRTQRKFEVKLTWCRRPIKGNGTAFIICEGIDKISLLFKSITLPSGRCEIKLSRQGTDLICFNTGQASEEQIRQSILTLVGNDERIAKKLCVRVVRLKVQTENREEIKELEAELLKELIKYYTILQLPSNKFRINLLQPKESTINYTGFIQFDKLSEGEQLCNFMKNRLMVKGQAVQMSATLKTTLHIPSAIMIICKSQFDEIMDILKEEKLVEVGIREMKLGDFVIDIKCDSAKHLVEARDLFQELLDGEIIDCGISIFTKSILNQEGKQMLNRLQKQFNVLLIADKRKERIHIYGSFDNKVRTKINILTYFEKLEQYRKSEILLAGNGKTQGILKEIMKRFGDLPRGIIRHFQLNDVKIDFKQQKLCIFGAPEAVNQIEYCISEIEKDLASQGTHQHNEMIPECVGCMCPIESHCELYRLEGCGHGYCNICLKTMVCVAVEEKQFPIECAQQDCSLSLVWKDVRFCLKQKWISETKLGQRSLDSLVATNPNQYKFCKTPNCPVVYEVTTTEEGHEFNCPACFISLCTSCHSNYHVGLSCKMFVSQHEANRQIEIWKTADPKNRKLCPGCSVPVEKIQGCDHICFKFFIFIITGF
ncbi:hypothetical protein Btru_077072 [Bulinus truncatus]|nr:hypothetical protein Btru_077072 [Bulinus truncatus]